MIADSGAAKVPPGYEVEMAFGWWCPFRLEPDGTRTMLDGGSTPYLEEAIQACVKDYGQVHQTVRTVSPHAAGPGGSQE